jgi:hypothetical protein
MNPAFRTLIIAAQDQTLSQQIAATLGGQAGENMWIVGLSADGQLPATHYVSTGCIGPEFADMMPTATWEWQQPDPEQPGEWVMTDYVPGNAALVAGACAAAGLTVTEQEIEDIYSRCDVTVQEPFVAFARLGLQVVQADE